MSLYDATSGDSWKIKENWKSDFPICEWHGVSCDPTSNKVIRLDLSRNNLNGSIPPSLWRLESLQSVSVRSNLLTSLSLTGLLTTDPVNDPRSPLETLTASENHLSDIDGISYAQATMKQLNVNKNQIQTKVLEEVDTCLQLEILYLAFNQIPGTIPTTIGRLTQLTEVYLFDNRMEGTIPTELGLLDLVQVVGLGNNKFTGTLPTEVEQMVNVKDLSIHHVYNQADKTRNTTSEGGGLTGPLLTFGNMPYLSLLFLDGTSN